MKRKLFPLEAYRSVICLDQPFYAPPPAPDSEDGRAGIVDALLAHLVADGTAAIHGIHIDAIPSEYDKKRRFLKALLTVRGRWCLSFRIIAGEKHHVLPRQSIVVPC